MKYLYLLLLPLILLSCDPAEKKKCYQCYSITFEVKETKQSGQNRYSREDISYQPDRVVCDMTDLEMNNYVRSQYPNLEDYKDGDTVTHINVCEPQ